MPKRQIPDEVRRLCYARDGGACQWNGCGLAKPDGAVVNLHHLLPEQFGGKEIPENLITLCDIHHKNMHVEFSAFYPDSQGVLLKMGRITRQARSRIRRLFGVDDGNDLTPYLEFLTGHKMFRVGQLKTIRAALSGKNVLLVTPTGSGKSVCYQMPGFLGDQPTMVVSPLKALMKDQVESIWSKKIPTTYINSDLSRAEKDKRYQFINRQLYKFIFVAPERFESSDPQTSQLIRSYSHLVIDEAHEIEMWGMAFRPSYAKLGQLRERLGNPPVIALTATASTVTQRHILESLNATDAEVIVTGFYRPNITIKLQHVQKEGGESETSKYRYLKNLLLLNRFQKILIFVPTLKWGEQLLEQLKYDGIDCAFFHSKLGPKTKMEIQNRFTGLEQPGLYLLISTSAFGMGIDIPDIRHVVHYAPPLSITDYVQQIGRAGRDGDRSYAHLLFGDDDPRLMRYMAELPVRAAGFKEKHGYADADVERVRAKLKAQVDEVVGLAKLREGEVWPHILRYFGETELTVWIKHKKAITDAIIGTVLGVIILAVICLFEKR